MSRPDLIRQLATLAVDLDAVVAPASRRLELDNLCTTARLAFGAAAASVATLDDQSLHYVSASGYGADIIVGTDLPVSRGIAGFVALTGQALAIDRPTDDPRFARDIAEKTGYIPSSMLVVPITASHGDVAGVLSVLDRTASDVDALALASAFAVQAAAVLEAMRATTEGARLLLAAVVEAAGSTEPQLADALGRSLRRLPVEHAGMAETAATLAALRHLDDRSRRRVAAVIGEIVELVASRPAERLR